MIIIVDLLREEGNSGDAGCGKPIVSAFFHSHRFPIQTDRVEIAPSPANSHAARCPPLRPENEIDKISVAGAGSTPSTITADRSAEESKPGETRSVPTQRHRRPRGEMNFPRRQRTRGRNEEQQETNEEQKDRNKAERNRPPGEINSSEQSGRRTQRRIGRYKQHGGKKLERRKNPTRAQVSDAVQGAKKK